MVERKSDRWRIEIFGRVFGQLLEIWCGFVLGIPVKFLRKKLVRATVKDGPENYTHG
jgi:hypothetical protein